MKRNTCLRGRGIGANCGWEACPGSYNGSRRHVPLFAARPSMFAFLRTPIFCAVLAQSLLGGDICVDANNQTGIEDGSALHPYRAIQPAVNAAAVAGGDTVRIAGSSYFENIRILGKPLELLGGF